MVQRKAEQS